MTIKRIPTPFSATVYFILFLFILENLLSFESDSGSSLKAKLILLVSYFLLALVGNQFLPNEVKINKIKLPNKRLYNLIRLMVFLGPIFLAFDRFYIRGLSLNSGITSIRHTMEKSSEGSVSSFFSVFGYLGCALCFILLTRLIVFNKNYNRKNNIYDFVIVVFAVLGVSILTGGRSTIFITLGFIYGSYYCKLNLLNQKLQIKPKTLFFIFFISLLVSFYSIYVFSDRAKLTNIDSKVYYSNIVKHLHGRQKKEFNLSDKSDEYIYTQLVFGYFVHQFWIFEKTMNLPSNLRSGDSVFITWKTLLSKVRIVEMPKKWYYQGFYIPLIGVFVYKYGMLYGLLLSFSFLLLVCFICSYFLKRTSSLIYLFFFNLFVYVFIFSSMLPSTETLMFPMLLISIFLLYPFLKFISKLRLQTN